MGSVIGSLRPTRDAIARHSAERDSLLPREVHVHPDGKAVAVYERSGAVARIHYATIYDVLDKHGLGTADLEEVP